MNTPARTLRRESERREAKGPRHPNLAPTQRTRGGAQFVKDTYSELKKVVWPTRQQTLNLSTIVLVVSLILGVLLGAVDWIFTHIMQSYLVPGI